MNDKLIVSGNSPDNSNSKIYVYRRADVSISHGLILSSSISNIEGIHFDWSKMWASSGNNAKLYRCNGNPPILLPDSSKDINLHTDNRKPKCVNGHGNTIWVFDEDDDKIYAYSTASGNYGSRRRFRTIDVPLHAVGALLDYTA